ncbi:MAG: hypothetical protein U0636_01365 [Phycisphaerales bacterium]
MSPVDLSRRILACGAAAVCAALMSGCSGVSATSVEGARALSVAAKDDDGSAAEALEPVDLLFTYDVGFVSPDAPRFMEPRRLSRGAVLEILSRRLPSADELRPNDSFLSVIERVAGRPVVWLIPNRADGANEDCLSGAQMQARLSDPSKLDREAYAEDFGGRPLSAFLMKGLLLDEVMKSCSRGSLLLVPPATGADAAPCALFLEDAIVILWLPVTIDK